MDYKKKHTTAFDHCHHHNKSKRGTGKTIGSSIISVLIAIVASSHHWIHMLLITLGLGTLGTGLYALPTPFRIGLMILSVIVSFWMLVLAWKKRANNKTEAWIYLISSVLSLVIILTSLPTFIQPSEPITPSTHQQHH